MVNWITRSLGVQGSKGKLKKDEYGSIIIDVRNVTDDGLNDLTNLIETFNKVITVAAYCRKTKSKLVIQCEAGISRSCTFVVVLFVHANNIEWQDAIDFVKKKVPAFQVNDDLIDSFKRAMKEL